VLLSCRSSAGQEGGDWRQSSLHVGPLWFPLSDYLGYVRVGLPAGGSRAVPTRSAASTVTPVVVEVAAGSRVVLKPAAGTAAYFRFLTVPTSLGDSVANQLPAGATGYTFGPCPGSHGAMTAFLIAFSIQPGRTVPVQVWTSPSARPVWLTFTAPTGQLSVNVSASAVAAQGAGT
jgi:hypothetical protein